MLRTHGYRSSWATCRQTEDNQLSLTGRSLRGSRGSLRANAYGRCEVGARRVRFDRAPRRGQPVYRCERPNQMLGLPRCFTLGGLRIDAAIAEELFRVADPMANGAAMEAEQGR